MQQDEGDPRYHLPPVENGKPQVLTNARKARKDVVAVESEKGGRGYQSLASPLEFYVARGYISGEQYRAGTRLHGLWRGSIFAARYATMKYATEPAKGFDPELIALMPRDYMRALDSITKCMPRIIVRRVCCFEETAGSGKPMELLRDGLDMLVKHFRH